jgi:phage tail tape-measure protein
VGTGVGEVGSGVGACVGAAVGAADGAAVGACVGDAVGVCVGSPVGTPVGFEVYSSEESDKVEVSHYKTQIRVNCCINLQFAVNSPGSQWDKMSADWWGNWWGSA